MGATPNRRSFLLPAIGCLLASASVSASQTVGAIRWDAWNGRSNDIISNTVAQTMAPIKYHWRLPWFAQATNESTNISFDADKQSVMDEELRFASKAGLSFWAYDTYCVWPEDRHIPQCEGYWGKDPECAMCKPHCLDG